MMGELFLQVEKQEKRIIHQSYFSLLAIRIGNTQRKQTRSASVSGARETLAKRYTPVYESHALLIDEMPAFAYVHAAAVHYCADMFGNVIAAS